MRQFDLFEFYRFVLAVLVIIYGTAHLVMFIWRWQGVSGRVSGRSALLYRYFVVLLARTRLSRFAYDLTVIGGLAVMLALLLRWHWS